MSIHSFRPIERDPDTGEVTVYAVGLVGDDPNGSGALYEMGRVTSLDDAVKMTCCLNGGAPSSFPGPTVTRSKATHTSVSR